MARSRRLTLQPTDGHVAVTPLELFFDLVFVFALTQVTASMADDPSVQGVVRGVLVVSVLWWSWVGYAWLANVVRPDEGPVRLAVFAAMAAVFVFALAIPEAFEDLPGGLTGPVVVAVAYLAVRLLHLALFSVVARDDPVLRRQLFRFAPSLVGGTALLLAASQFTGWTQTALWAAALVADFGGTFLAGASGWRLRSTKHFAERHGLILIVALGESIVAIGVGVEELAISWPIVVAAVLGLVVAAGLWWTYFDVLSLVAERVLARTEDGAERARLARDSYSYLHLPMVVGIVLTALGLKKVLEYVGDTEHHTLADPLTGLPLVALYGGVALYLLGQVSFRLRNLGSVNRQRVVAAAVLLVAIPLVEPLPALGALAVLAAVTTALVTYEAVRFGDIRDRVRHLEGTDVSGHDPRRARA